MKEILIKNNELNVFKRKTPLALAPMAGNQYIKKYIIFIKYL